MCTKSHTEHNRDISPPSRRLTSEPGHNGKRILHTASEKFHMRTALQRVRENPQATQHDATGKPLHVTSKKTHKTRHGELLLHAESKKGDINTTWRGSPDSPLHRAR